MKRKKLHLMLFTGENALRILDPDVWNKTKVDEDLTENCEKLAVIADDNDIVYAFKCDCGSWYYCEWTTQNSDIFRGVLLLLTMVYNERFMN